MIAFILYALYEYLDAQIIFARLTLTWAFSRNLFSVVAVRPLASNNLNNLDVIIDLDRCALLAKMLASILAY